MRNKYLIIFSLFLAYSLLLAHTVIPHHHHDTPQEAEHHHHSEHTDHHHDSKESEGHDHTPHFVHAPDFGNHILTLTVSLPDFTNLHFDLLFVFTNLFVIKDEFANIKRIRPPDSSPPISSGLYSTFSLRGPPYFIS